MPPKPPADTIVLTRRCHTLQRGATGTAIAISTGRIVMLGPERTVLRTRARRTRVIDVRECVATPGLVDCHTHFFYWALQRRFVVDVASTRSRDEALRRLRNGRRRRVGEWLLGTGFDQNRWGSGFPTAAQLDAVVGQTPTIVRSRDGHSAWLNTAALHRVGWCTADTPDPPGGRLLRDSQGCPAGVVQESAVDRLPNPLRDFGLRTDAAAVRGVETALQSAYAEAWRVGLTGFHSMDDRPSLTHLQRQRHAGTLGLRVVHAIPLAELEAAIALGLRSGLGDDWLRIGGVKIFADGALGSQTAWMYDAYPGRGDYVGIAALPPEVLSAAVERAAAHGLCCWVHAIGDRAVHEVVTALSTRPPGVPAPALPHRVEHAQCIRPRDMRRMAQRQIVGSVQPCHLLGDIDTAERHWPRARTNTYPFRRLLDAGIVLAGGSDVPIESPDPRRSLFAATMRTREDGTPADGWYAQERLTPREAVAMFTVGAARSVGAPAPYGTLAVGAPADITLWEDDPLAMPPAELRTAGLRGCIVDGVPHVFDAR